MIICNATRARLCEAAITAINNCPAGKGGTAPIDVQGESDNGAEQLTAPIAQSISANRLAMLEAYLVALAITLVCGGCSVLAPHQDRTHFILLGAARTEGSKGPQFAEGEKSTSAVIGLGPVQLPEYLDRPELVIRTSPNGFELSETDRWAEPLGDSFRHVLANDLTNLLGTANIVQYPWYPGTRLDYRVRVQVQRFEVDTSNNAELVARWELTISQAEQPVTSRDAHLSHAMASRTGDAAAAALSEDVAELAGQIALAITQIEQQRLARGLH